MTPPPDSVEPFDQINLRIEPVTTVLEAQQAAGIQPQVAADMVSQPEVGLPASEQSFYPECGYSFFSLGIAMHIDSDL